MDNTNTAVKAKRKYEGRKYLLHKHCIVDGYFTPLQEKPDVCIGKWNAIDTFKDAFKHLLGHMPRRGQVQRLKDTGFVVGRSGKHLTYHFTLGLAGV